ncbi:Subtilase family protein [Pedococcus dokdonensis]|uniref:Subtilase family protein n=1 Tax=Pedococcus dokdonensis TaxID=443156 RepID=A0A1H0M6Z7_9MICO|nr:S53 family peptidase [Pedococcus dokdonensis]SDO76115.1 Subtilase family protein [Pedococcus dokdonensis]
MSRLSRTVCAAIGAAALVTAASAGTALAAPAGPHALPGSVPSWAVAKNRAASTDANQQVTFRVYLNYRGGDAAAAYATAVSTPGSANYRKFLTPAQFRAQFSPAQADVDSVSSWLKSQGFTVGATPANRKYVEATGTLAQAAKAFDTSFAEYRTDGKTVRGNTTALKVPANLTAVEGVVGLDESQTLAHQDKVTPGPALFRNAQPMSDYWGQKTVQNTPTPDGTALPSTPSAFAPKGYAGAQLQGLYGMGGAIGSGNDGRGVTVGIIDAYASPTILQDANTYSAAHGLPSLNGHFRQVVAPGTYNRPENPKQDPQGWAGEETLDVEAVHTMAPGADITYIGAPNNYRDMDAIMNRVVDGHLADIVTNSYGYGGEALPNGTIKPSLDTQIQAAAEGMTLFFSSGDDADETGGVAGASPTPDWPASSPYVTAVGGTSAGVSQSNSRVFEVGWETGKSTLDKATTTWSAPAFLYGSGGGTSRLFAQPSYQAGVVPDAISKTYGGAAMRTVPDVAALGDPNTGMLVGETQTFPDGSQHYSEYRIGGTSLASPLYAGMFALAQQKAGHAFGLANPVLYRARTASIDITKADLGAYPGDVRSDYVNGVDATGGYVYSARWFDRDESLTIHVRPGYDDVTGVGVPQGQAWLAAVSGS